MTKSKIFLWICLLFLGGIFLDSFFNTPQLVWLGLLILSLGLISLFWRRSWKLVAIGVFCLALAGGIYKNKLVNEKASQSILPFYHDQKIILQGRIIDNPEIRIDQIKFILESQKIIFNGYEKNTAGKVLVTVNRYPEYQYGDFLEISGVLKTPQKFSDFDYQEYLAKDDIYSVIYYPQINLLAAHQGDFLYTQLFRFKNNFEQRINSVLAEPQASFLAGLILGERKSIPAEILEAFNQTGTTHLIALSGYNITILAVMMIGFFGFLTIGVQYSFWLAILAIICFVLMTGAMPSVVRAAIMGILILIARRASRLYNVTNALVFAGAVMVFINPKILRFDLGFQLSFLATLGLIYLAPTMEKRFRNLPKFFGFKESLVSTLSAQAAVLPLLLISFKKLSLIAPLANILVLPVIPLTMLLGFLAGGTHFLFVPLAKIFAWLTWLFLTYEIKVITWLSKIPWASIDF